MTRLVEGRGQTRISSDLWFRCHHFNLPPYPNRDCDPHPHSKEDARG